jgi:predicted DsbA family dithiol-disulfide isomerase
MQEKPKLSLAVISDYICRFCYIGYLRLEKLRAHHDPAVNWALVEIHPESPVDGKPVETIGYSRQQLDRLLSELGELAHAEGVTLSPHTFTTNSHLALLLAEVTKQQGAEVFYTLHRRLFESFLIEAWNIGDTRVSRALAQECGVSEDTVNQAWSNPTHEQRLQQNMVAAIQNGVTGTPTFLIGDEQLTGTVSVDALMNAAKLSLDGANAHV